MDDDIRTVFKSHTKGADRFTRRMAVNIADHFGMRPMSMVWKLEKLGLLRKGSWSWFKDNGGITKYHEAEARADRTASRADTQDVSNA